MQLTKVQMEAFEIFVQKNTDYGDTFAKYGPVGVLVRIGDKIGRAVNISNSGVQLVANEGLRDTLLDLHNYAAMAVILLDEASVPLDPHGLLDAPTNLWTVLQALDVSTAIGKDSIKSLVLSSSSMTTGELLKVLEIGVEREFIECRDGYWYRLTVLGAEKRAQYTALMVTAPPVSPS
jgi:hypothetical protein